MIAKVNINYRVDIDYFMKVLYSLYLFFFVIVLYARARVCEGVKTQTYRIDVTVPWKIIFCPLLASQ
jgi:hypothetical protein